MKRHRKTRAGAGIVMLLTMLLIMPFPAHASYFQFWPANPRFKVNYSGTPNDPNDDIVLDTAFNLVWTRNVDMRGYVSNLDAINYCNNLVLGVCECNPGLPVYDNWRLPSNEEFETMFGNSCSDWDCLPCGHPFVGLDRNNPFNWSSSIWENNPYCTYYAKTALTYGAGGCDVRYLCGPINPGLKVWPVHSYINVTTTTTSVCDADYWKNLYEQTKAELDACQNPTTTTAPPTNIRTFNIRCGPF